MTRVVDNRRKKKKKTKTSKPKETKSQKRAARIFSPPSTSPHFTMSYTKGDQCWNGPKRSVDVFIHCGIENKIRDVVENGRCHYEFTFESPGVCNERVLKLLKSTFKAQKAMFVPTKSDTQQKEDL